MPKSIPHILLVLLILILIADKSYAQLDPERIAWGRIKSGKWESAQRLLKKSLRKNASHLEANYVLANWFFSNANPDFHIDSAYRYVRNSIRIYDTLSLRDKEKVLKFPIDSLLLAALKMRADSAAFERAKRENTEAAYIQFIKSFGSAIQVPNAVELRDEVSFLEALKTNTYTSFYDYLQRYPQSHRANEASTRYEKLLFDVKTKDKRLASFKQFLNEFPSSPHAGEASLQVFELATASGEPEDFFSYLREFPSNENKKFVRDILFHIYKDREEVIPEIIMTDSLKQVIALDAHFWVPFLKNEKFGFMDQTGTEVLPPQFQELPEEYKCGPVFDDILSLPDGYFSRTGKKIAGTASSLQSVGFGFLSAKQGSCLQLIHKSGRMIIRDCYDEYKILDDNFIVAKRNGFVTLFTLTGRQLLLSGINGATDEEGLIVLQRGEKKIINTIKQLAAIADGSSFYDELVFDEVLVVDKNLLKVRNSGMEGILDSDLNYVVPLAAHTLTKTPFGMIEKQHGRSSVRGLSVELDEKTWDKVSYHKNWLLLYDIPHVHLFDIASKRMVETNADSIWFDRSLTFVEQAGSQKVYLSATHSMVLQPGSKIKFIASRDSVQFFFTENKNKFSVFDLDGGKQLFATEFELNESLGTDYFIVSKGVKKGVLARNGKLVVPIEMDAIILTDNRYLSLLKDKKFGLYDLDSRKIIKPMYERNLILLDKSHVAVYKEGAYGVMDLDAKPVTEFEFSEVQPWSDSIIWAKKNFQWVLLNYRNRKIVVDQLQGFTWIKNTPEEKIARIHREDYYGIVSSSRGVLVPTNFTEIINLGSADVQLYFTEKHVEEAGIFVVVYFDKDGKFVRRQSYEEDEYEQILCGDH